MSDPGLPAEALATIEAVAGAIRAELGAEVDAYPGCREPEGADPLNRAFRAAARALLAADGTPAAELTTTVSRALRRVAERRLASEGWDSNRIRALIEEEPGSPDDWLCFLTLSSRPQIEPPLDPDRT
ncbi:MAG: hypothetical protein LC745_07595 [Planctomycetia bacterium]|nr:hypothetical protein [Planctomycetia bacterium]